MYPGKKYCGKKSSNCTSGNANILSIILCCWYVMMMMMMMMMISPLAWLILVSLLFNSCPQLVRWKPVRKETFQMTLLKITYFKHCDFVLQTIRIGGWPKDWDLLHYNHTNPSIEIVWNGEKCGYLARYGKFRKYCI